jgi:hypothetical protein
MAALAATALGLTVVGLAVRLYMGREAEDRLAAGEAVSIVELRPPLARAAFLACPPGYCTIADAKSPIFDMPRDRLHDYWTEAISGEKRMIPIAADAEARRFVYIQHSPALRFPDIVTIEFVQLAPERSSIAIYSRSRYGEYDFGKNRKRVEKWLVLLQRMAQPAVARRD